MDESNHPVRRPADAIRNAARAVIVRRAFDQIAGLSMFHARPVYLE